jgi:GNAT superfamily N-acetyltransferase
MAANPPDHPDGPRADDATAVRLSVRNAAAFWAAVARTRGHELVQRPGILAVIGGERAGLRILLLHRTLDASALAVVHQLVEAHRDTAIVIEDQFARSDFGDLGLTAKRLPVMFRDVDPLPEGETSSQVTVAPVSSTEELRMAEDVVVHGFPLPRMQPYVAGEAFTDDLLWYPGVRVLLARRDGIVAGACLTVDEGTCGGIYWVTTMPDHRSQGVGRALMRAALTELDSSAVSLTATEQGEPLYLSMGFRAVASAAWWSQ